MAQDVRGGAAAGHGVDPPPSCGPPGTVRVVGPGRAGSAFAAALATAGWRVADPCGRGDDPTHAAAGADLVLICTPDDVIAEVAGAIRPRAGTVVAHVSGSRTLEVLAPHPRRASIHPLVSLTGADDADRLRGAWFAVAGDPLVRTVVAHLGGRAVTVDDADRVRYHAAACVAANHLVALMAQVARIAPAGVPLSAYLALARGALDNVERLGPAAALTGPAARGDAGTLRRHREALAPGERALYDVLAGACAALAREGR